MILRKYTFFMYIRWKKGTAFPSNILLCNFASEMRDEGKKCFLCSIPAISFDRLHFIFLLFRFFPLLIMYLFYNNKKRRRDNNKKLPFFITPLCRYGLAIVEQNGAEKRSCVHRGVQWIM